ncbi:MAG: hypothetical protein M5U28_15475 [Sandaracinaceae bacterium]|nr:hypothetical protein [Sandaracinaceae bacterium]
MSEGGALFQALLEAIESEELREDVMGLRKEWEDKARELGKREGRVEGRVEGRAERTRGAPLEAPAAQVREAAA